MSYTIKIGGDGHSVELTGEGESAEALVKIVEEAYVRTRPGMRGHGIGFGAQIVERTHDRQPAGSPWQEPATAVARCLCNDPPPTMVGEGKNKQATRPPGWACPRHGQVI